MYAFNHVAHSMKDISRVTFLGILGLDVHVVVDCCSSRSLTDRKYALERLRDVGAFLTTSECVILGLAPDAAHPKFRQIQKLVMNSALDTGLL